MAYHWLPPHQGALKVNVHGVNVSNPLHNGNTLGIGVVYRNQHEVLRHFTCGMLPNLSVLGNQLWAVYAPMRRAYLKGYKDVIIETDNYVAFKVIKDFDLGAPTSVFDVTDIIDTLRQDKHGACTISYVFPARNRLASYTARLGLKTGDRLYTMDQAVGGIEEIINWDLGLGIDHPDFYDVVIPPETPLPVHFNVGPTLLDQVHNLGLGQASGPGVVSWDRDESELNNGVGVQEEIIFPLNIISDAFLFAAEPPLN